MLRIGFAEHNRMILELIWRQSLLKSLMVPKNYLALS